MVELSEMSHQGIVGEVPEAVGESIATAFSGEIHPAHEFVPLPPQSKHVGRALAAVAAMSLLSEVPFVYESDYRKMAISGCVALYSAAISWCIFYAMEGDAEHAANLSRDAVLLQNEKNIAE
jgi:hypothetical protein